MTSKIRRFFRFRRRLVSLKTLLPAALVVLVVLAVAPVLAIGYLFATEISQRLLSERSDLIVDGLENQLRGQLDPVEAQFDYFQKAAAEGVIDPEDPEELATFAFGVLAGTPQLFGFGIIDKDLAMTRWERGAIEAIREPAELLPQAEQALDAARAGRARYWAEPIFSYVVGDIILSYRLALEHEGELRGVIVASVASADLARYVAETSEQFDVTAFVFAGRDKAITYPGHDPAALSADSIALPPVSGISDPVLAGIWNDPRPLTQTPDLVRSEGHWTRIDGVAHAYYYREIEDYGPEPLVVGVAIPSADTWIYRWAPTIAAVIGLVLMIAATLGAWRLGVVLSRPTSDFDGALKAVGRLDFETVALPRLTRSPVREWRAMARRLEETAQALTTFRTYLPRALVRRIFRSSQDRVTSQEREITVMFIDLEGFTVFSEGRDGQEVVAFLNGIFEVIGPIIEETAGVIDKYTGDGLLAFWGAPDVQPDHAARACRSAGAIAAVLHERPDLLGGDKPRLRIGLHTGPAVVGNIGFPGRINYTLVGDTVNVAARTEAVQRGLEPERPVVIAATQEVFDALGSTATGFRKGSGLEHAVRATYRVDLLPEQALDA